MEREGVNLGVNLHVASAERPAAVSHDGSPATQDPHLARAERIARFHVASEENRLGVDLQRPGAIELHLALDANRKPVWDRNHYIAGPGEGTSHRRLLQPRQPSSCRIKPLETHSSPGLALRPVPLALPGHAAGLALDDHVTHENPSVAALDLRREQVECLALQRPVEHEVDQCRLPNPDTHASGEAIILTQPDARHEAAREDSRIDVLNDHVGCQRTVGGLIVAGTHPPAQAWPFDSQPRELAPPVSAPDPYPVTHLQPDAIAIDRQPTLLQEQGQFAPGGDEFRIGDSEAHQRSTRIVDLDRPQADLVNADGETAGERSAAGALGAAGTRIPRAGSARQSMGVNCDRTGLEAGDHHLTQHQAGQRPLGGQVSQTHGGLVGPGRIADL